MFSGWRIAKSAEEMVSRWAVKRVCKFFLKKKLGQFILGEIDLDQLDVQLSDGSIQLNDLALNVDYLNQKFGGVASVMIKEGSVGSLLVKMPWKGKGCQVELDELELVLAPCRDNNSQAADDSCSTSQGDNDGIQWDTGQLGPDGAGNPSKFTHNDVHEGVMIIAKMVKWFLTSFHVKIKKLIVAYDPCIEKKENKMKSHATLVLRISEIECGTCISDDSTSDTNVRTESFLGINRLTNFVKFEGAIVELVHVDAVDHQSGSPYASGIPFGEAPSCSTPSDATTSIMSWRGGGVSGNVKLSIPWKDGSLDIREVDADVCIDPIELKFQPNTIKWFLLSWETYQKFENDRMDHMLYKPTDSVHVNENSHFRPSASVSNVLPNDNMLAGCDSCSSSFPSLNDQESVSDDVLPASHLILDWVPFPVSMSQKDGVEEVDLGASVDQFFECFDGMRHSQSALGSSGMWNWTCSVFSAITAASSLASGSLHVPCEQQHVQTNLKATFAGVSIVFSFYDEDQKHSRDWPNVESHRHYLCAECRGISLVVQVYPQRMKVEGTLNCIEVAEFFRDEIDVMTSHPRVYNNNFDSQTVSMQHLQAEVQGALPPFPRSASVHYSDAFNGPVNSVSFGSEGDFVKVLLLRTSGVMKCKYAVDANQSHGCVARSASFSLKLPPLIFWVNFHLINMLWDLSKEIESSMIMNHKLTRFSSGIADEKDGSSNGEMKRGSGPPVATLSATETLQGDISIPDARVILCFPFSRSKDTQDYCSWDQFIALDFSSPSTFKKGPVQEPTAVKHGSVHESFSSTATRSVNLNVGDLDIYLVSSSCKVNVGITCISRSRFSVQNILSVSNSTGLFSVVSMLWQEGHVTGPWIAERAKFLATFEESKSRNKCTGKGSEFAAVNRTNDLEDSQIRREIIMSSAFFVCIHVFPVKIDLDRSQYDCLHGLFNQITSGLSCVRHDCIGGCEEYVSQTSILLECDSMELIIRPDIKENIKGPLQSELPGSWHCLKLSVEKLSLLFVSNIGGNEGAGFFWLAHGEGTLCGCVSEVPSREFLLISVSNSTMKRGDGGGSNALSSRLAGSDIVHLLEPKTFHGLTSITVRCSTVVAVGGRLDWLETVTSFFSLPSLEVEESRDGSLQKGDLTVPCRASFVLNLVDIGLSYEPHFMKLMVQSEVFDSLLSSAGTNGPYVACLLAASSFVLSSTTLANSLENDYEIKVQDLGLLLCSVLESDKPVGTYSVRHLHEIGYVKVARETLLEAVLRTNCKNGLLWELECSNSHVYVDTCHDTTSGLTCLVRQLQQIFSPDMKEFLVHLQDRYNGVQHAQEMEDFIDASMTLNSDTAPPSQEDNLTKGKGSIAGVAGLMDEISEDAFHLNGNKTCQLDSSESEFHISFDDAHLGEACSLSVKSSESVASDQSVNISKSMPLIGLNQTSFIQNGYIPEFIEGYCLADLRPLSELAIGRQSSPKMLKCRARNMMDGDFEKGNSGWYGEPRLRIIENHLSGTSGQTSMKELSRSKLPSVDFARPDDPGKAMGRVRLNNISVTWRMYAGSDWHETKYNGECSSNIHGRDTTACLELALFGMQFQYDLFPIGGIFVSRLSLSVRDFHLYDRSRNAPWKLVLGHYDSKDYPRESSAKAFKLDLEAVRPNPQTPLEEYRLRVALLPLLLHLHQSQLDFLIDFFGSKNSLVHHSPGCHQDSCDSKLLAAKRKNLAAHNIEEEALLPFFQKFDIWPILVRIDYSPSRVDLAALRGGKYVELVNLVPWKGVELTLKHVHSVGIYGWGGIGETIVGEWLEDISQNQIHKVLRGLPTIRSFVAVGSGAAKLVSLPVESYRKDKRVLKGMQRGTIAFLRSISLEAVGLGVHLAAGAHDILLQAEYILTSIPPSVSLPVQENSMTNVRCNQPQDAQQGFRQAYVSLSDGLGRSASALVQAPLKRFQRGASAGSVLATAVRGVPSAALAPASGCASALHNALLGLRNSLDPERKKESVEKYLGPAKSREQN